MFWIVVAAVVVAVIALGWWTSGRPSSAINLNGAEQSISNGNAQFEHMRNQQGHGVGGGTGGGG